MIVKPEGEASLPQISSKLFEYSNTEASSFIVDNYDKLEKAFLILLVMKLLKN